MNSNKFHWHSLKTRVTFFTLAIFLVSIWSLGSYASMKLREDMQRQLGDQQLSTVSFIAADINHELDERLKTLEKVAASIPAAIQGSETALQNYLQQREDLQDPFNAGVLVYGKNGTAIADVPLSAGRLGLNFMDRDFVAAALKDGKSMIGQLVMGKKQRAPVLVMITPIRDGQGKVVAALAGVTNLAKPNFLDIVAENTRGKTGGYLLIAPQHRQIVVATNTRQAMETLPATGINSTFDHFLHGHDDFVVMLDPLGVEVLASNKSVPVAGWVLAAVLPTEEAFAPIHDAQQRMLLATIFFTVLAGILTWWMLQRELLPMVTAARTLTTVSESGQTPQPLPITRRDEVGKLIGGFNSVLENLRKSEERYRSMVEWSPEAVAVHRGGKLLYVNPAAVKMFDAPSAQDLIGKPILDLVHPDYRQIVLERAQSGYYHGVAQPMIKEKFTRLDGTAIDVEVQSISTIFNGLAATQVAIRDITERKQAEDEIQQLAFFDPLTRLPNRRLLMDRLQQILAASERHQRKGALLFIDIDNFKTLNDTLGHANGDLLLQQVAKRLTSCIREGDTAARLGGDEFMVILENLSENVLDAATQAETVGEKILTALNQTFTLRNCERHSTSSIGITLFGGKHENIEEPLKRADLAMYQAKAVGRNTLRFFDPQMQVEVTANAALETDIREALEKNMFLVYYQAQVAGEGRVTGVEALVRWQHPRRGLVSPNEFIALAEETGLILSLGSWVLETACTQLALWASRPEMAHLTMAVNVSARQFHQGDFVDQTLAVLERTGANPNRLKLELTESLLVRNVEDVIVKMNALKEIGIGFSLDDFGTGYSSLSYLKRLPLDQLKIDQGFVRDILIDANDSAIAKMVIALAQSMGLAVIAEGVENDTQRDFLAELGCHAYQGYLFSRPLPLAEFEALMTRPEERQNDRSNCWTVRQSSSTVFGLYTTSRTPAARASAVSALVT